MVNSLKFYYNKLIIFVINEEKEIKITLSLPSQFSETVLQELNFIFLPANSIADHFMNILSPLLLPCNLIFMKYDNSKTNKQ
ncbi:hypothetical protein RchiOBHm_Chr4g0403271 [Rosa chinensis]|uniref:Uncharacterized protein n=1 Tax=Rosa chinensis TaxID=74649 RepID=A0A2P6QTJ5_ROSCH|nr:hypothetical protein RchiOBHm_Chr4g0403271 [Rosa chinensis]